MPLSHACTRCGMELCRLRAAPRSAGCPAVVVCPRCGVACVRRRHPLVSGWRSARRATAAAAGLVWQGFFCILFTLVLSALLHSLRLELWGQWPELWAAVRGRAAGGESLRACLLRTGLAWDLVAWACFSVGLGAWLVAGFSHWRPWAPPLAWVASIAVIYGAEAAWWWAECAIERECAARANQRPPPAYLVGVAGQSRSVVMPSNAPAPPTFDDMHFALPLTLVLPTLVLAVPGAVGGLGMRAIARAARSRRFRKRLLAGRKRRRE